MHNSKYPGSLALLQSLHLIGARAIAMGGWTAALLAGLFYGGWAYAVNAGQGPADGIYPALVQGVYSFLLTLCMTVVTSWIFNSAAASPVLAPIDVPVSLGVVGVLLFGVAYGIHWSIATPHIILTIAPGFLIGMTYSTVHILLLKKAG